MWGNAVHLSQTYRVGFEPTYPKETGLAVQRTTRLCDLGICSKTFRVQGKKFLRFYISCIK